MKYYGDYLGFQFGEHHSRDLGLYRVSDGDRYNDVSIPSFTDTTSKIPGGDGTYYWDSFYSQRTFTIQTVFDDLTESQLRQIRQIFNGKAEDWLIFDETPYKKYRVKLQSPPQIKYLTFREKPIAGSPGQFEKPRVHKGEIVFQFISYYPYGIDNFKAYDSVEGIENNEYPNTDEWLPSVPILSQNQKTELENSTAADTEDKVGYFLYNPGDLKTGLKIILDWYAVPSDLEILLMHRVQAQSGSSIVFADEIVGELHFQGLTVSEGDTRLVIDTATNLIYGVDYKDERTGTFYNKYLIGGDFFKVPPTQSPDDLLSKELTDYCDYILINVPRTPNVTNCKLEYDYLYY